DIFAKMFFFVFAVIFFKDIIDNIELSLFTFNLFIESDVITNVYSNIIIVYGVNNFPMIFGIAVVKLFYLFKAAVRDVDKSIRYSHGNSHAVRFVGLMVLVGPPSTGS